MDSLTGIFFFEVKVTICKKIQKFFKFMAKKFLLQLIITVSKKKVLSPELLKKVNKGNFIAWTTYLTGALVLRGINAMSVRIRDKVASNPN